MRSNELNTFKDSSNVGQCQKICLWINFLYSIVLDQTPNAQHLFHTIITNHLIPWSNPHYNTYKNQKCSLSPESFSPSEPYLTLKNPRITKPMGHQGLSEEHAVETSFVSCLVPSLQLQKQLSVCLLHEVDQVHNMTPRATQLSPFLQLLMIASH